MVFQIGGPDGLADLLERFPAGVMIFMFSSQVFLLDNALINSILSFVTHNKGGCDELLFLQVYPGRPCYRFCLVDSLLGEYCLDHHWRSTGPARAQQEFLLYGQEAEVRAGFHYRPVVLFSSVLDVLIQDAFLIDGRPMRASYCQSDMLPVPLDKFLAKLECFVKILFNASMPYISGIQFPNRLRIQRVLDDSFDLRCCPVTKFPVSGRYHS